MRLSFGQDLRQVQKMALAPRMIQSMEILQLPQMALLERIEQELQENPLLELAEEDLDPSEEPVQAENPDAPTLEERELVVDEAKNNADDFERLLEMNDEWPDTWDERPRTSSSRIDEEGDRAHDAMANREDRPRTLQDYLRDQLGWFDLDVATREMCERIIYALDHSGRAPARLAELIDSQAGPDQLALAERALAIVQRLDPPGIAARDLRECLLLQITPATHLREELRKLIAFHLEDIEHNRWPVIQKKTGYSMELIQEILTELRKLNPTPGTDFETVHAPAVTPDLRVEPDENGKYTVILENERVPSLHISPYYRKMLADPATTDVEREWIKRKINSAQWLIESIEQRRGTVTRVAQAIVDHQTEFLDKGPEFIEPLKMQQIADKVGVHVTTVSRAVDDKYMQTPRGIFALKRFFGGGTTSAAGEEVAWDAVRLKLQEIVDHEDKSSPYSDDDLVAELANHGLTVARRTVTKYRKAMNIPSSRQRRDWTLTTPRDAADHDASAPNASGHGGHQPSSPSADSTHPDDSDDGA